jgi:hypothetical protein
VDQAPKPFRGLSQQNLPYVFGAPNDMVFAGIHDVIVGFIIHSMYYTDLSCIMQGEIVALYPLG